ncbi:hypothetical protein BREVNS_1566 [Brevinematales bacterium NS]|jgi:hypothetical protein|nr:hypothetical protein [Brevinematales bacterium]QJR22316.1 hypothetical protein BREVNS_1566 [Brevinematales bacterium NS]
MAIRSRRTTPAVFPFSLFLKLLLAIILILFLALGVMGTILEDELKTVFGRSLLQEGMVVRLLRLMQVMGFAGTVVTLGTFFLVYIRGLTHYQRLYERTVGMVKNENIYQNLSMVTFPTEDILGNLGSVLNQFMKQITYFDQLKTSALKRLQERFEFVADLCPLPVLLLFLKKSFPTPVLSIRYANKAFLDLFAKKGEDEYFDIEGLSVEVSDTEEELSLSSMGERFERMYQAEMAEITLLTKKIRYMVNQTLASLSPQVLTEKQEIVPLHESKEKPGVVICKHIEFYPFLDIIKGEDGKTNRVVKEVLLVFREYEKPKEGLFSSFKKREKHEES